RAADPTRNVVGLLIAAVDPGRLSVGGADGLLSIGVIGVCHAAAMQELREYRCSGSVNRVSHLPPTGRLRIVVQSWHSWEAVAFGTNGGRFGENQTDTVACALCVVLGHGRRCRVLRI